MSVQVPVWQVGSGDSGRSYSDWMIKHQIVAIGSGWAGPWPSEDYGGESALRQFAEEAQPRDLVIAKRGRHVALAIGVLGEYEFDEDLDDIKGWDLCHYRRVRWLTTKEHRFSRAALYEGKFSHCWDPQVLQWVGRAIAGKKLNPPSRGSLPPLPASERPLDLARLSRPLVSAIKRAKTWQGNVYGHGFFSTNERPCEKELLTHVTVPLLEALGWPPAQIAIEWGRTDIALFTSVRREPASCRVVIEGKRIGDGLGWAAEQVRAYAKGIGPHVDTVATDGIGYEMVLHTGEQLHANLQRPRESALQFFDALKYKRQAT